MNPEVCAVVITYHPHADLAGNLELLSAQVETILLVDNHSSADELVTIRAIVKRLGINLVENSDNVGIGAALNLAIGWTKRHTLCKFILFFDQDSSIFDHFVVNMLTHYRIHATTLPVFVVVPLIIDRRTGETAKPRQYGGKMLVAQTSGSLLPMHIFDTGMFNENLFIDYVDYEFCLRMIANKWNILFCESARLMHEPGNVVREHVPGSGEVTTYNYSPLRHYYLCRNRIWMLRTYTSCFPRWGIITLYGMLREMLHVLRFERDRRRKATMWWRGLEDGFRSNLGKLDVS